MSLKIAMLRNAGASSIAKLVGSACTLALVPILLAFLGVEKYGIWLVIAAVPSWLSIADVGFGSVAANEMSIRVSRDDWKGAEAVFQSAWAAILALSALTGVLVSVMIWYGDWPAWLSIHNIPEQELSWCLFLLGLSSITALQGHISAGLFRAASRADLAILIGGSKPLLDLIAISVALFVSKTVLAASIGLLCSQIFLVVTGTIFGLRACPRIRPGFSGCNRIDILFCFKKGMAFCLFPMGNAFVIQGSTLIVNHVLGAPAVVVFNTCRTMTRSAQQLMNLIGQSAWPEFSHLVGSGDLVRARKLHHLTLLANLFLAFGMTAVLITVGPVVYSLWTGRLIQVDRALIAAFCLGIVGNAAWFASATIVSAANRHERLAVFYLLAALLSIPFCYFGAVHFGLHGAALASVSADLLIVPVVIFQANLVTRETFPEFCRGLYETGRSSAGAVAGRWRKLIARAT